jgi:hypothetical protein
MNIETAINILKRYAPCPHNNASARIGDGTTWACCPDCGLTFLQKDWKNYEKAAYEFDEAIECVEKGTK